jgi:hypothetical protein
LNPSQADSPYFYGYLNEVSLLLASSTHLPFAQASLSLASIDHFLEQLVQASLLFEGLEVLDQVCWLPIYFSAARSFW